MNISNYVVKYIIIILLTVSLDSCKKCLKIPAEVNFSLNDAGKNKKELIKVLKHYNEIKKDSLKFKAATFLISNMINHHSTTEYGELHMDIKSSFFQLDSLIKAYYFNNKNIKSFNFVDPFNHLFNDLDYKPAAGKIDSFIKVYNHNFIENITSGFNENINTIKHDLLTLSESKNYVDTSINDLTNIKANFLIDRIDNAFKMWEQSHFARNLDFVEFSQTLLPYRNDKEPVGRYYTSDFHNIFKDILNSDEVTDIEEIVRRFNLYIHFSNLFKKNEVNFGYAGLYDVLQWESLKCERRCYWSAKVLNSCGIPTMIDFTPSFSNKVRGKHYWITVRDTSGKYQPFNPLWQLLNDSSYFRHTSKVYRLTLQANNKSPYSLKHKSEQLPELFNSPYIKDVTDQYHKVVDITIPLESNKEGRNLYYLSIFNPKRWEIIAWGITDSEGSAITFKKVPVGITCFPGIFENNTFKPIDNPFFVSKSGTIKHIITKSDERINMHLTRKYPPRDKLFQRMADMEGTIIQGSNKNDFSDMENLYTLTFTDIKDMAVKALKINKKRKFRYIRIIPPSGKLLNLAILEFYTQQVSEQKRITIGSSPYILSKKAISEKNRLLNLTRIKCQPMGTDSTIYKVMDANMDTWFVGYKMTFDLGKSMTIDQIRIAPRNANNGVVIGDTYELLYFDKKWNRIGSKKAEFNYLSFNNIPSDKVYWLRNINRGKEELSFLYKNGKQYFINHDDISGVIHAIPTHTAQSQNLRK